MPRKALIALIGVALVVAGKAVASRSGSRSQASATPLHALAGQPRFVAARPARRVTIASWGHGSWCWFADPRAVHVDGPYYDTFVGWIDWQGRVMIGAYSSFLNVRTTHVLGHLFHDDHGSPSILVEPDKRLTVFWSAHNGPGMYYRTTTHPEDISTWGPTRRVPPESRGALGFTYPNPVLLPEDGGKLFLFWRGADWSADYAVRSAAGRWQGGGELVRTPGQRPYVKVASDGTSRIAFAFTQAHPRNALTSVYYMTYRNGWLRHAGGRRIKRLNGKPMYASQADLVYDARRTGISSWVWDVAFDAHHRPVIVYATFPSPQRHLYWYARWTGRRWATHFLTVGGPTISPGGIEYEYSGGMDLDHSDPSVIYLSRKVRGWYEIERWQTSDGGAHWRHVTVVRTPGADDVRPVVTRGGDGGPMSLLFLHGHYGSYTDYRTSVDYLR